MLEVGLGASIAWASGGAPTFFFAGAPPPEIQKIIFLLRNCPSPSACPPRLLTPGNTAMHYCIQYGYTEVGDYFQAKGANDNVENSMGMTCYEGLGETPR